MKVAVYGRVSSDEQKEQNTIEVQLHAVRQWCEQQGHEIVETFADEGVSGAIPLADRPAGARLIEAAESARGHDRPFEAVVSYSLDRLGRDALAALLAIKRLKALKVPAVFVRESFDDSPAGRFQATVMSAVSELERDLITQRMSGGRLRAVREGAYLASAAPWGYRFEDVPAGEGDGRGRKKPARRLAIDEEQARWVRQVFEWAIEGHGVKEIADRLEAAGVPVPAARHPKRAPGEFGWSWSTVAKMLKSRRYMGEATYGTNKFGIETMACPAIISEATFAAAQAGLARRKLNAARNVHEVYVLRSLLYCGHCGAPYHGRIKRQPDGTTIHQYECGKRRTRGPVAGHEGIVWRVNEHDVLPRIQKLVDDLIADPARAIQEYDVVIERTRSEAQGASEHVRELERRLEDFPVQEQRITDAYRRGHLTGAMLAQQLDAIASERKEVEAALREARLLEDDGEGMVATLELLQHWLATGSLKHSEPGVLFDEDTNELVRTVDVLSPEEWRTRIMRVVSKVVVEADGSLTVEGPGGVIYGMTIR